jgi:hypothetical protein
MAKHRIAPLVACLVGAVWAMVQVLYTRFILETDERVMLDCSLGPQTALLLASVLVVVALIFAVGLMGLQRFAACFAALGVEAIGALLWVALGGLSAAGCAGSA